MPRKALSKDKAPVPAVMKHGGRLTPITPYDEEALEQYANGTEFDLVPTGGRSNKQLRYYYLILSRVCEQTDRWPTKDHLHRDIKLTLGYVTRAIDLHGNRATWVIDSIDFDTMEQHEFNTYFEKAMAALAEYLGYDPRKALDVSTR